jgi:class 3 adenylate cyclase
MPIAHSTYRMPLQWRILLSTSAVLVVLIVSMLAYVNFQAHRFVTDRISADLEQGSGMVRSTVNDRLFGLALRARLVASIPYLEALLAKTDPATVRDALTNYQQQNHGPDLLIVLDPRGRLMARTDGQSELLPDAETRWVRPALSGETAMGFLKAKDALYAVAAAPSEAGGMVFGIVLAGERIREPFARRLQNASQDEIVIADEQVIGSTLPESSLPWHSRTDWVAHLGDRKQHELTAGGELYDAVWVDLPFPNSPAIICLQSQDKALAPYRRIQIGLLLLGLLATLLGVVGSAMLARHLTKPVAKLVAGTREVAAGNFSFRVDIARVDEIGDLAEAFNLMTEGLRERADMQKFVSQSTLEMIQSAHNDKIAAGERKTLTVFFSDIRGFTSLSERRQPEHVVRILNQVFSIQADWVKRFSGDIDKYVGDALVAFFDGQDAALNAVRCAIEINRMMDAYNDSSGERERIDLGIGIATGEVILGSIGSEDRRDFTVIGSHVNLCSRLCSIAKPREILLSQATYDELQDSIAAERLPPQHMKGFTDEVAVYRIAVRARQPEIS